MIELVALYILCGFIVGFLTGFWLRSQIRMVVWQDKSILSPNPVLKKQEESKVRTKTRIRSIDPYKTKQTGNNSGKD